GHDTDGRPLGLDRGLGRGLDRARLRRRLEGRDTGGFGGAGSGAGHAVHIAAIWADNLLARRVIIDLKWLFAVIAMNRDHARPLGGGMPVAGAEHCTLARPGTVILAKSRAVLAD